MPESARIPSAAFTFLKDLKKNNDRAWFKKNEARFETDVREPLQAFIRAAGPKLKKISPHLIADDAKNGRSLFRIHRDTRFSADKSPYKTWMGVRFPHAGGSDEAWIGYYLHVDPGESGGGGGSHMPASPALQRIRDRILEKPAEWTAVRKKGITLTSMPDRVLKTAPRGVDPNHPHIEDLRHKDFFSWTDYSEKDVTAPDFLDRFVDDCKKAEPLNAFLAKALGIKW